MLPMLLQPISIGPIYRELGEKLREKEACSTGKIYGRLKGSFFQRKSRECCLLTSNKKLQEAASLIFTFLSFALKYFNKAKKGKIGI